MSVRWRFAWLAGRFRCLFFRWISLVQFAESGVSVAFRAGGLFRTFVEAAVVVGSRMYQFDARLLPAMPVGECGVK